MCGLVGVMNPNKIIGVNKIFKQLLHIDTVRGTDSFGVYNHDTCKVNKDLISTTRLLKRSLKDARECSLLVGHNRAATVGAIDLLRAHPFSSKNIVMAHNGTLFEWGKLTKEKALSDSHAICLGLSERNNPLSTLEMIDGAFALSWVDKSLNKLYLTRNEERPLFFAKVNAYKNKFMLSKSSAKPFLVWASEEDMLHFALKRNDWEDYEIVEVNSGTLYSFDIDDKDINYESKKYTVKDNFLGYSNHYIHNQNNNNNYNNNTFIGDIITCKPLEAVVMDEGVYCIDFISEDCPETLFSLLTDKSGFKRLSPKGTEVNLEVTGINDIGRINIKDGNTNREFTQIANVVESPLTLCAYCGGEIEGRCIIGVDGYDYHHGCY